MHLRDKTMYLRDKTMYLRDKTMYLRTLVINYTKQVKIKILI